MHTTCYIVTKELRTEISAPRGRCRGEPRSSGLDLKDHSSQVWWSRRSLDVDRRHGVVAAISWLDAPCLAAIAAWDCMRIPHNLLKFVKHCIVATKHSELTGSTNFCEDVGFPMFASSVHALPTKTTRYPLSCSSPHRLPTDICAMARNVFDERR